MANLILSVLYLFDSSLLWMFSEFFKHYYSKEDLSGKNKYLFAREKVPWQAVLIQFKFAQFTVINNK